MQRHGRRRQREQRIAAQGHGLIHSPPRSTEKREKKNQGHDHRYGEMGH